MDQAGPGGSIHASPGWQGQMVFPPPFVSFQAVAKVTNMTDMGAQSGHDHV
jgi:hypothetical protein